MVMPIDDPPDQLYGLIDARADARFQFDIIPQSLDPSELSAVGG